MEYYMDIEVDGLELDPAVNKIITIQWCRLGTVTGRPIGELSILEEWKSSEKTILQQFLDIFKPNFKWDFIPIGDNVTLDLYFLRERWKRVLEVDIPYEKLFCDKPYIDIRSILVIWNRGSFRGSGLGDLLDLERENIKVPEWYKNGEHDKIIDYVKREARIFISNYQRLKDEIPKISLIKKTYRRREHS